MMVSVICYPLSVIYCHLYVVISYKPYIQVAPDTGIPGTTEPHHELFHHGERRGVSDLAKRSLPECPLFSGDRRADITTTNINPCHINLKSFGRLNDHSRILGMNDSGTILVEFTDFSGG